MKIEYPSRLKPYALSIGLSLCLLVLLSLLLVEWVTVRNSLKQPIKPDRPTNSDSLGPAVAVNGLGLPHAQEFREFVERPLFMETRRKAPPAPPGPPPRLEPPAPVTFQLMGVINSPKGLLALVGESKGRYRRLRLKDTIDGWEVKEIRPDRLFLEQGNDKQDIGLIKKRPKTTDSSHAEQAATSPTQNQSRHAPQQQSAHPQGQAADGVNQEQINPDSQAAPNTPPNQGSPSQESEDQSESY